MSKKLQAASYKLQASTKEPKAKSCALQAWNYKLKLQCKSLRLAFELETHLLAIQQQRWFRKDKIETRLALIPVGVGEEWKMLTTFINRS